MTEDWIGSTLGHYEILSPLGKGGMGEVYLARDAKLGREVALKVIPPQLAEDAERLSRFHREARSLAALNHPNIVTIYSVEEVGGVHFLIMERAHGTTLQELIPPEGLDTEALMAIAAPLAEGLAAAHDQAIHHRDLKPANVMVSADGLVKILDFGLAKAVHPAVTEASDIETLLETRKGVVMGTPPYMAPEQLEGKGGDARSDVFSLGIVLHEMASGRRPFRGDTAAALASAILRDEPEPLVGVPEPLADVVGRCLKKSPSERFADGRETLAALSALESGEPTVTILRESPVAESLGIAHAEEESIAVLPFVNMSTDAETDYFSEGLSEEIINTLSRLPELRVIARTSAFRFRGEQNLKEVGEILNVRHVLEGSVRRAGQRLRIAAQLIDVANESNLWSERFDRELTDVFEIQDEIAHVIAEQLRLRLAGPRMASPSTRSVEAYEALLEGRHHWYQFTPESSARALACYERALSIDPDYVDAIVDLGYYHSMMAVMFTDPREALPKMNALAARALLLAPDHGDAHALLAFTTLWNEWDWATADGLFRRAQELAPASTRPNQLYGVTCLLAQGDIEQALTYLDRNRELDPLAALFRSTRARVLTCARRFEEAEACCRRGLELDPAHLLAKVELGFALAYQRKYDEALAIAEEAVSAHGPVKIVLHLLGAVHALAGRREEAVSLVEEPLEGGEGIYRSPFTATVVYSVLSENDAAFYWARRSLEEQDPMMMYLNVHPVFDSLRADPRYPALLRELNLD